MIAAAGADDLEYLGVAAFETAVHDADRLAPHVRRHAVAGLSGSWEHVGVIGTGTQPRITAGIRTRRGDGGRIGAVHGAGTARTARGAPPRMVVLAAAGARSSDVLFSHNDNEQALPFRYRPKSSPSAAALCTRTRHNRSSTGYLPNVRGSGAVPVAPGITRGG